MWVKMCANTTMEDARLVAAEADAVGFVFARASRRLVTAEVVAEISAGLAGEFPEVERFGVFDSVDAEEILRMARATGLTGVQLHGDGGVALARRVRALAPELAVMAVVHWETWNENAGEAVRAQVSALRTAGVERVLLDSKVGAEIGGTGVRFSWEDAARALLGVREGVKLVVAGGLRQETVGEAIRVLKPWGVDVASGVEAEVRRKSVARVREFAAAARAHQGPGEVTGA